MQSDDNQPRQDDENSQVKNTEGLCGILCIYNTLTPQIKGMPEPTRMW